MITDTIYIIDDHQIFLLGLKSIIEQNKLCSNIKTFLKESELHSALLEKIPNMIIADHILEETTGIELIHRAKLIDGSIKGLLISSVKDEELKESCLGNNIEGYIYKSELETNIILAISTIIKNGTYFSNFEKSKLNINKNYNKMNPFSLLTNKELHIVHHLIQGNSYEEISDYMYISPKTVQQHCYNITQKLGKLSRLQLAQKAYKWGVINNLESIQKTKE